MADANAQRGSAFGWLLSLTFWLSLVAAVAMYGSVALAPRAITYLRLDGERRENQRLLVGLDRQVAHLERVNDALVHDPDFAAELARINFDAARPGDDRIPVGPELSLSVPGPEALELPAATAPPWYETHVRRMAEDATLRNFTLGAASLLTILAFTFLQDTPRGSENSDDDPPRPARRGPARSNKRARATSAQ